MRTKRIELEGTAGTLAIERQPGPRSSTIRIDSIIRDPKRGEEAWKTWEINPRISEAELFKLAETLQERTDGCRGTNSDIHDYMRELERFTD